MILNQPGEVWTLNRGTNPSRSSAGSPDTSDLGDVFRNSNGVEDSVVQLARESTSNPRPSQGSVRSPERVSGQPQTDGRPQALRQEQRETLATLEPEQPLEQIPSQSDAEIRWEQEWEARLATESQPQTSKIDDAVDSDHSRRILEVEDAHLRVELESGASPEAERVFQDLVDAQQAQRGLNQSPRQQAARNQQRVELDAGPNQLELELQNAVGAGAQTSSGTPAVLSWIF